MEEEARQEEQARAPRDPRRERRRVRREATEVVGVTATGQGQSSSVASREVAGDSRRQRLSMSCLPLR